MPDIYQNVPNKSANDYCCLRISQMYIFNTSFGALYPAWALLALQGGQSCVVGAALGRPLEARSLCPPGPPGLNQKGLPTWSDTWGALCAALGGGARAGTSPTAELTAGPSPERQPRGPGTVLPQEAGARAPRVPANTNGSASGLLFFAGREAKHINL